VATVLPARRVLRAYVDATAFRVHAPSKRNPRRVLRGDDVAIGRWVIGLSTAASVGSAVSDPGVAGTVKP